MDTEQTNLSLQQALGVLRRRAPWILLCVVARDGRRLRVLQAPDPEVHRDGLARLQQQRTQPSRSPGCRPAAATSSNLTTNVKLVQLGDVGAKTASVGRLRARL